MARFQTKRENNMTTSTKAVNYSDADVAQMTETYLAATDADSRKAAVASIAKELGKNVKSVIAKLSREGVYVKLAKVTKTGKAVTRKEDIVKSLASQLDLDFANIKSLGKATKADLETLLEAVS